MRYTGILATAIYVSLYAISIFHLNRLGSFPLEEALTILVVLGLGFSLLAWVVTISVRPLDLSVKAPALEMFLTVALTAGIVGHLLYLRTWTDGLVPDSAHGGNDLAHMGSVLAIKLLVFVLLPYWAFRLCFGLRWRDFGLRADSFRRLLGRDGVTVLVVGGALCVFQFYAGSAAAPFREGKIAEEAMWVGLPLAFVWLAFEVGMTEEFFFRAIVQERLSAFLRSDVAGLMLMALVFGLVHAPGIVLRGAGVVEGLGAHPDIWEAAAYTIAVHSVAAFMFGIVWLRTRNLVAVVLIHAATDLLSNSVELMGAFGLLVQTS